MRTSLDACAADATNVFAGTNILTTQTATFTFTSAINTSSAVTIRLYAYSAEAAGGTWGPTTPVRGINYYRIRSAETTGAAKLSIIVKVDKGW